MAVGPRDPGPAYAGDELLLVDDAGDYQVLAGELRATASGLKVPLVAGGGLRARPGTRFVGLAPSAGDLVVVAAARGGPSTTWRVSPGLVASRAGESEHEVVAVRSEGDGLALTALSTARVDAVGVAAPEPIEANASM